MRFITRWGICDSAELIFGRILIPWAVSLKTRSSLRYYILHGSKTSTHTGPSSATILTQSLLKCLPWSSWWCVHFSYNPILFLLLWQIDFCLQEWSTGTFLQAAFFEKDVLHTHKIYQVEVEAWSNINLAVTSNIRKKLFSWALYVHFISKFFPILTLVNCCCDLVIILVLVTRMLP